MTGVSLKDEDGDAVLSFDNWMTILRGERVDNPEMVVALAKVGPDACLRLSKVQWHRSFKKHPGLVCAGGNRLRPGGNAGAAVHLTRACLKKLGIADKARVCITKKDGSFFVKRFTCRELVSEAPGWMVIDEFSPGEVIRWCASCPELATITPDLLDRMLSAAGKFRRNPVLAVADRQDDNALPQKKELLGEIAAEEEERLSQYVRELRRTQLPNGSWGNSAVTTAGSTIRLLQSGVAKSSSVIRKAVAWLEQSTEPVGMPGMFVYEEAGGKEYNSKMAKHEDVHLGSSRAHRNRQNRLAKQFFGPFEDLLPKGKACEPQTTWSTALALQALLRCGRSQSQRVRQAIKTLLLWRCRGSACGGWCGCGVFGSTLERRGIDPNQSLDFDSARLPKSNKDLQFATWFTGMASARHMVCNAFAEDHICLSIGPGLGLLARNRLSPPDSSCTTVLQSALAWHPEYRGSALEALAAYEMTCMQNPNGDWPSHRVSGMLHFLSLIDHPLARYLACRTIPGLIRRQKDNGLWFSDSITTSANDILILQALKKMGYLERLLPK